MLSISDFPDDRKECVNFIRENLNVKHEKRSYYTVLWKTSKLMLQLPDYDGVLSSDILSLKINDFKTAQIFNSIEDVLREKIFDSGIIPIMHDGYISAHYISIYDQPLTDLFYCPPDTEPHLATYIKNIAGYKNMYCSYRSIIKLDAVDKGRVILLLEESVLFPKSHQPAKHAC